MDKRVPKHGPSSPLEGEIIIRDGGYKREGSVMTCTLYEGVFLPTSLFKVQEDRMVRRQYIPNNKNIFHTHHYRGQR
jgi:hypothetical protein